MLKLVGCRVRIAVIFTSRYIQMPNWIEDYDVVYCLMLLGIVISTNHMPAYIFHSLGAVTARVLYNEKHSLSIDPGPCLTNYTLYACAKLAIQSQFANQFRPIDACDAFSVMLKDHYKLHITSPYYRTLSI